MVIVALYLIITPFKSSPIGCTAALIMVLLGLPVYYVFVYRKLLPECCFSCLGKFLYLFLWPILNANVARNVLLNSAISRTFSVCSKIGIRCLSRFLLVIHGRKPASLTFTDQSDGE